LLLQEAPTLDNCYHTK